MIKEVFDDMVKTVPTPEEYKAACLRFSADASDWGDMDSNKFYTTHPIDGWAETGDNAHGGLHIEWAFKRKEDFIEDTWKEMYIASITELVKLILEDRIE